MKIFCGLAVSQKCLSLLRVVIGTKKRHCAVTAAALPSPHNAVTGRVYWKALESERDIIYHSHRLFAVLLLAICCIE